MLSDALLTPGVSSRPASTFLGSSHACWDAVGKGAVVLPVPKPCRARGME